SRADTLARESRVLRLLEPVLVEPVEPEKRPRALDVGTGDGTYALEMSRRGARVIGVDVSDTMLDAARKRAEQAGLSIDLRRADVQALPFPDGHFDCVVAVTVLCFVDDAARALSEMSRVLVPGGRLVIGELAKWSTWAAKRRVQGWLGSETWEAARFRTRSELRSLVEAAGLSVLRVEGAIHYPPSARFAELAAKFDATLGRLGAPGAAFIAVSAQAP
ncbi:MAG: class I SAM-dependent methyltransferase, partial [Persicimonas sp.]